MIWMASRPLVIYSHTPLSRRTKVGPQHLGHLRNKLSLVDDTLLLAVCTYNKQIRLYTLKINWQVTKQGEQVQLNPTIDCQHIAVLDSCTPHHDPAMAYSVPVELSGLHVIPRGLDTNSLPLVLAVFTSLPPQAGTGSGTASTYTILSRWELRDEVPTLDTSFLQLGSKKSGAAELKVGVPLYTKTCTDNKRSKRT
jgi:hypothetical protein